MSDQDKTIRLAAVQAAPVFLDIDRTTEKACELIREAGRNGADVIGFPEGFIPGHPGWQELIPATGDLALTLSRKLFKNAVEVPGLSVSALGEACREARVAAVVGINERRAGTTGSLFNSQLFFDKTGSLLHKHQKIVPTIGERVVHAPGLTGSKAAATTSVGTVSGLICGENSNPLSQYAIGLDYPVIHVASWPAHFSPGFLMQDVVALVSRGLAYSLKTFVINSIAVVDDSLIEAYGTDIATRDFLQEARTQGGASIIGPGGQFLAGPMEAGEGILYADVRTDDVIIPKFVHDYAGHYNRPELFAPLFLSGANTQHACEQRLLPPSGVKFSEDKLSRDLANRP